MSQILNSDEILGYFTLLLKKKMTKYTEMHYGYMYIQCSAHNMYDFCYYHYYFFLTD